MEVTLLKATRTIRSIARERMQQIHFFNDTLFNLFGRGKEQKELLKVSFAVPHINSQVPGSLFAAPSRLCGPNDRGGVAAGRAKKESISRRRQRNRRSDGLFVPPAAGPAGHGWALAAGGDPAGSKARSNRFLKVD